MHCGLQTYNANSLVYDNKEQGLTIFKSLDSISLTAPALPLSTGQG